MNAVDMAGRLGLTRSGHSWRGDCPSCGYVSCFCIIERRGRLRTYCANGCSLDALTKTLARVTGGAWRAPDTKTDPKGDAERQQSATAAALRIWNGSTEAGGTLADAYLTSRALPGLAASAALRFRGDCTHPAVTGRYPALVALVVDVFGTPVAAHRTYLDRAGRKARVDPVKASKGPVWGSAIRLDPVAPEIVIGEGIETSASLGRLLGLPAWAALSAGNLERGLVLPQGVHAVTIAADADAAGERAASQAAERWRAEGRRVHIARPNALGRDFNDILCERMMTHAA